MTQTLIEGVEPAPERTKSGGAARCEAMADRIILALERHSNDQSDAFMDEVFCSLLPDVHDLLVLLGAACEGMGAERDRLHGRLSEAEGKAQTYAESYEMAVKRLVLAMDYMHPEQKRAFNAAWAEKRAELRAEVEALRAAAGQASFCLRTLLPDDADAKLTVQMLASALAAAPAAPVRQPLTDEQITAMRQAKVRLTDGLGPRCDTCAHTHKKDDTHPCRTCDSGSAWELAARPPRPYSPAAVGAWISAAQAKLLDLAQQLADEQRQHAITRGELERTRFVRDELNQTSADLCPQCNWRFVVPGRGCLNCGPNMI